MRHLVAFLLLGLGAHGLRLAAARAWPERPVLEVTVPEGAAVRDAVDRALLLEEARRAGWVETDPVIRRRLAMNVRFLRGEASLPEEAGFAEEDLTEALALGLDAEDPVVRERLVQLAEALLVSDVDRADPGDDALRAFLEEHRTRFLREGTVAFEHRFFEGGAPADALPRLRAGEAVAGGPFPLDLGPGPHRPTELDRRLGEGFGAAVAALEVGRWGGPVPSAYGEHLVRPTAALPGALPPLRRVRAEVLEAWRGQDRAARRRARLDALRRAYDVRVRP